MSVWRQKQTLFGQGKGNCFAACLASMLGVPLEAVPNFCVDYPPSRWFEALNEWLAELGFTCIYLPGKNWIESLPHQHPGLTIIVGGKCSRGDHAVIYRDGKLDHDPHPSGDGLSEPEGAFLLVPLMGPTGKREVDL